MIVYLKLIRPEQYYKNLIVFLAIFFSGNVLNFSMLVAASMGFVALCILSSGNYIINDIADRNRDRLHKEKAERPIASRKVSPTVGLSIAVALYVISMLIGNIVGQPFLLALISLGTLSTVYTFLLKHEMFADIITIAVNFVIRAVSGALAINVWISPWLIVGTFFLALFLATGKRKSELVFLRESAGAHRPAGYSHDILNSLLTISTSALLISYALYAFLGSTLLLTLPIVLYVMLRYLTLIYAATPSTRITSKVFKDKRILMGMLLYGIVAGIAIYGEEIWLLPNGG